MYFAVTCKEAWEWPETRAFLERLGVNPDRPITHLGIEFNFDAAEKEKAYVRIMQHRYGVNVSPTK
jgi:hypothetical protein